MNRPFFPPTIDSTMLSTFRSCPRKFYYQYVMHWKPRGQSVHLVAGGAFASGLEAARNAFYVEGRTSGEAEAEGAKALLSHYGNFQCPDDSAKSPARMLGALEFYFSRYPLGADNANPITTAGGKQGIEFSFAETLPYCAHPTLKTPILYTGRSDLIAERGGSGIYVYDEKTTSSLGTSWAKQWEMRGQFTGYTWAAQNNGIAVAGCVVRGISILKTKYDTLEVITNRAPHEVSRWLSQTVRDVRRMQQCWEEGEWDYALDSACNEYGGCAFTSVCKARNPDEWLPVMFTRKVWNPLERRELSVREHEAAWGHIRDGGEEPAPELDGVPGEIVGFEDFMKGVI